jgi:hypothetical protein
MPIAHFSVNAIAAVRCVPEGQLESRLAIYRRYWCFRICSRPGGTIEISWLKRFNLAKGGSSA